MPRATIGVGAAPRLVEDRAHCRRAPQANTNPQAPIFTQQCCRIWLVVVIIIFVADIILGVAIPTLFAQLFGAPGGQGADKHGCVTDGGYRWCEATKQCQRPWEHGGCPEDDAPAVRWTVTSAAASTMFAPVSPSHPATSPHVAPMLTWGRTS